MIAKIELALGVLDKDIEKIDARLMGAGRGVHSSTSQLILSRFGHKIHPEHPLILLNTP